MPPAKTLVAIRHVAFEDLGGFAQPLEDAGYTIRYHDIGVHDLSDLKSADPDLLVVLGGPIGVYEEDRYPFLADELALIRHRLAAGRPLIGICLGAQLIAAALGSRVYPGPAKEIGFAPLELTEEGQRSCLNNFGQSPVLHWHGDTFDLPTGAMRLASTPLCANQAFSYGERAIAFQFHPEGGGAYFERWLIGHTAELSQASIDVNRLRAEWLKYRAEMDTNAAACIRTWLEHAV